MEPPLSPLNQGLNPLRSAPLWGQLVALPTASPAIHSRIAQPVAAPLWLALPLYRSSTPISAGLQLLVPGFMPSTELPAGEWIYLPARRSASAVEEGLESLG